MVMATATVMATEWMKNQRKNKYMNRNSIILSVVLAGMLLAGCAAPKDVAYLSAVGTDIPADTVSQPHCTIQTDDLIAITVSSETPESAIPFNQESNRAISNGTSYTNVGSTTASGYLVDLRGCITFPVFGTIKVAGLTTTELADTLEQRLIQANYITDPEVSVRLLNYKVTVLGEVARPGQVPVAGERITLLEALAYCGDLTIYGQRKNVMIIRDADGRRSTATVDLTDQALMQSPYYYLQQNDVVYVEPNRLKKMMSQNSETKVLSIVSTLASLASTVSMVFYYYKISTRY